MIFKEEYCQILFESVIEKIRKAMEGILDKRLQSPAIRVEIEQVGFIHDAPGKLEQRFGFGHGLNLRTGRD